MEAKISNNLLKFVLECECECFYIDDREIELLGVTFESNDNIYMSASNGPTPEDRVFKPGYKINLHTFIHLAKIKCFKYKYSIDSFHDSVEVVTLEGILEKIKLHEKEPYSIIEIIDCLEWVCDKVGGGK